MLRRLVADIHGRSLWQALGIFLAGGWGVLQVIDTLTQHGFIPDWVFPAGLVLLLLGIPVLGATAYVQRGTSGDPAIAGGEAADGAPVVSAPLVSAAAAERRTAPGPRHHRLFTWRNVVFGGVGAFSLLGLTAAGYMGMRTLGIGSPGTLLAKGAIHEREPVLLADFANATPDSTLGRMVTEALRVDLLETTAVSVLSPAYVAEALQRTGRKRAAELTPDVAREIAVRDGIKAVVQGDVGRLGDTYVLTASIVQTTTGDPLAAFRETARGESELLDAVDRLSRRIRGKAGESLRSVRASEPLASVTTSSLEALRAFTESSRRQRAGDNEGALRLLESAIELDPGFAMAHLGLSVALWNLGMDPDRMRSAGTRAYELRSRLNSVERLRAEAWYQSKVARDPDRAMEAYRQLLREQPNDAAAINNLGTLLMAAGSRPAREEAATIFRGAVNGTAATFSPYFNLVAILWILRRDDEIEPVLRRTEERYADAYAGAGLRSALLVLRHEYDDGHAATAAVLAHHSSAAAVLRGTLQLAAADAGRGRLDEARGHLDDALRAARASADPSWIARVALQRADMELWAAGSPERARAALREMARDVSLDSAEVSADVLVESAGVAALAGDHELEARLRSPLRRYPADALRGGIYDANVAWAEWAVAMRRGDGAAALDAAERFRRAYAGDCAGDRCVGGFERGMALERLGRLPEAIAGYEEHLIGEPLGNAYIDAAQTPLALERLGELYERQGDGRRAASYYARFAELWKGADPALQPRVERAQQRAAALFASKG